jgi:predicted ATPase
MFLKMLQSEGLLHYSLGKFKWGWDEQKILSTTAATSNVVALMKQKIEKLPASVCPRLSIAACLGVLIRTGETQYRLDLDFKASRICGGRAGKRR